ncbi:hypothetical protein [Streptomyces aidingensis]|uniref:PAP2 superfamily protein n=1 Tax=Streptomyces aidingensis TaxID=910347 RepID=A0A1I1KLH6_9ACTN|nr:hypothetical protein [Streptomyces aidingensis]SFC58983.1 hypothetical protein SAMN05421773_104195 [Streptomyces aidingensis]
MITRTARFITDSLAPAYLVIAVLLAIGWHSTQSLTGVGWGLLAALFCGGIPFAVILLGVRLGKWTDKHVRIRQQRAVPLTAAMASVLAGLFLLRLLDAPREVFALVVAMLAGLVLTLLVTYWWKVSVHTAVAAGTVVVLIVAYGPALAALAPVLAAVGWSRVALHDHTPAQVLGGAALGSLAAGVIFTLLR